jgi:hypothetical protein
MHTLHPQPAALNGETLLPSCTIVGLLFAVLTALATGVFAQTNAPVRAELVIPPAETHVIGDVIPLYFRFENQTTNALAFMWEGCCRFNGKLTVTRGGSEIPPTPPGQALAHMFAKAERLDPGKPKDFDTRLSDWVTLADTGTYELRGRYQGVLPFQQPQVQRGLQLWRDTAETPPLQIGVLNVPDYLAQREARTAKRGVKLELSGPSTLPPLQPVAFKLKLTNTGTRAQTLRWPDAFQLWLVRSNDTRVPTVANIDDTFGEFTLAPGATTEREIRLSSNALEGEPLADYRLFVDLAADKEQPRVPSNVLPLAWKLSHAQIVALLNDAATGGRTGARNAPLKLLRVYLGELGRPILLAMRDVKPEAQPLASELAYAARIRVVQPAPGLAELPLRVTLTTPKGYGALLWDNAALREAHEINSDTPLGQLRRILEVRRHLGWEVAVNLRVDDDVPLTLLREEVTRLNPLRDQLTRAPRINLSTDTNRVSYAEFPLDPAPANLILRVTSANTSAPQLSIFRNLPPYDSRPALVNPATVVAGSFQPLANLAALGALLDDGQLKSPRAFVVADGKLTWKSFAAVAEVLRQHNVSFELQIVTP